MGSSWRAGLLASVLLLASNACAAGARSEPGVVAEAGTIEELCERIALTRLGRQKALRVSAHAPDDVVGLGDSWHELYEDAFRQAPSGYVEDAQAVLDYLLETAHLRADLEVINAYRGPNPDIEQATDELATARAQIPGLREATGRTIDACRRVGIEPVHSLVHIFPAEPPS